MIPDIVTPGKTSPTDQVAREDFTVSRPAVMGVVFLEGVGITILVVSGVHEAVFPAVPVSLKRAIAARIGWFILFMGLYQAFLHAQFGV